MKYWGTGISVKFMKRIGLFGGTFDPIHIGHLLMARSALEQMHLEKVVFIPSCLPPHKKVETLFLAKDRLKMVKLAVKGIKEFVVSDFEVKKRGKSYSIDTVQHFCNVFKEAKLFFIVGGDAIQHVDTWKESESLQKLCSFVSVNRPGYPRGQMKLKYHTVTMNGIELSSTEIRKRILTKKPVQFLVPDRVLRYIGTLNIAYKQ